MEKAYALLSQGRMNVSEVAWEVGYINVSHFGAAFRKQYGVNPKVFQVAWHHNPDLMTYAGVSRGYRSGGFNTAYQDASDIKFGSEFSWNYELGCKSSWFNHHLQLNTTLFFIEIKDQQIVQLLPSADTIIKNAGKSRSEGFEIETKAQLHKGLTLEAGLGYADSEFKDYTDPLAGTDYKGNRTPLAPEYTYNLALQYNKSLSDRWDIFLRTELNGIGSFCWDDANTLKQDSYRLVNMSLGRRGRFVYPKTISTDFFCKVCF